MIPYQLSSSFPGIHSFLKCEAKFEESLKPSGSNNIWWCNFPVIMSCFFPRKENVLWEFISGNTENSAEMKLTCLLVELISFLYLVGSAAPFHTKESTNRKSLTKGQPSMGCLNPLDSTAPKVKRGKEREIAKLKRPTALKKVNISTGGVCWPTIFKNNWYFLTWGLMTMSIG